jgi:hypothetical protein
MRLIALGPNRRACVRLLLTAACDHSESPPHLPDLVVASMRELGEALA